MSRVAVNQPKASRVNRQDLTKAKAAIEELFGKIGEIRRKAEQSEAMVQEICRDIKKLDYAKKHLTHTITALRRLAMLINAVGECASSALKLAMHSTLRIASSSACNLWRICCGMNQEPCTAPCEWY